MARPRKIADEKQVIELASKGLTMEEIEAFEDVSHYTIMRHFAWFLERQHLSSAGRKGSRNDTAQEV
jgi:hypothetical protein